MGTGTTPTIFRGIVVPDPRYRWDPTKITATSEAGPLPGVPVPVDQTEMVIEQTGTQAAATQLMYKTVQAGHPGDGAAMVWRYQSDGVDDWRGWDPPVSMSQGLEFIDATNTVGRWIDPHVIALADGTIIAAVTKDSRYVVVWKRAPDTGVWTEVQVYDHGSAYSVTLPYPTLVELPSGRLVCIYWREWGGGATAQIRASFSDDSGATWEYLQKGCLADAITTADYVPGRLRAAYLGGQIALVAHMVEQSGPEDQIHQWASNDLGSTFDPVSQLTGSDRAYPDLAVVNGTIVLGYVSSTASTGSSFPPWVRIIGAAYESLQAADYYAAQFDSDPMVWGSQTGGVFDSGELALWADEDGRLWIMGRDHGSGTAEVMVRTSIDGGENWRDPSRGPSVAFGVATWRGLDGATHPRAFTVCAHRGRACMVHQFAADPSTRDPSMAAVWLGGYTSVCMPQESAAALSPTTVGGFTVTWLPYDFPEDIGVVWNAVSTGSPSLVPIGMRLLTGAGQTETREAIPSGTPTEGVIVLAECRVDAGTARIRIRTGDATPIQRTIEVRLTTTAIAVYDIEGAALIDSISTTDADGAFVQIFAALEGGAARVWYRPVTASGDRKWTQVAYDPFLTFSGTVSANLVRFGQLNDSDTYWRMVSFSTASYTEVGITGQDNWTELLGRAWMPTPVYVDGGTSVQAVDGPTWRNEDWTADTRYTYPVANVCPDVAGSPRRAWRSTTDTVAVDLDVQLGTGITYAMGPILALSLIDANFGTAELQGQDAVGVWSVICTIDRRTQVGLHWGRHDRMIRPAAGGATVPYYLPTHILAGSYLAFADAGEGQIVRRIETNSPGSWETNRTSLQTRILLETIDGSEPTTGTAAELWSRDSTHLVPMGTRYRRYRLRIPAQDTAEGYFRIGSMVLGHFYATGAYAMQPGWGVAREWASSWEQVEGRTGARTIKALGPTRRATEVAWVYGVNTRSIATDPAPDWIIAWSGGPPVAVPADVPWSMPGLIEYLDGATEPVVYLESATVPANGSTPVHITDRTVQLYGRVMSESLRTDQTVGDRETGEFLRVGRVRIEEEV